jgi:hypothetical protein
VKILYAVALAVAVVCTATGCRSKSQLPGGQYIGSWEGSKIKADMLCTVYGDNTFRCFLMSNNGNGEVNGDLSKPGEAQIEMTADSWKETLSGPIGFDVDEVTGQLRSADGDQGRFILFPSQD